MSRTRRRRPDHGQWLDGFDPNRDGLRDDVNHRKPEGMGISGYLGEGIRSPEAKRRFKAIRSRKRRRQTKKIED